MCKVAYPLFSHYEKVDVNTCAVYMLTSVNILGFEGCIHTHIQHYKELLVTTLGFFLLITFS